jgi:hypothetical protein
MPRLTQAVPKYRKHKQPGLAIVTINGRDHLLGPHNTKASKLEYDRGRNCASKNRMCNDTSATTAISAS